MERGGGGGEGGGGGRAEKVKQNAQEKGIRGKIMAINIKKKHQSNEENFVDPKCLHLLNYIHYLISEKKIYICIQMRNEI